MAKKRTVNELRQVKDTVYNHPKTHLTAQEQRLLDDLNYKAMKNIWVVTMHRNSSSEHSYVVGVYENFKDAEKAANIEEQNRAGKYGAYISSYTLNELPEEL